MKIVEVSTGVCVKVLAGHRRTPWVVRFHPSRSDVLASGSLDNTVRVWCARTGKCLASRDFNKPIASIAFSLDGGCVLVASGHRLTYWRYTDQAEGIHEEDKENLNILLRTRRSLRCALFRPRGLPLILTAEVNDIGGDIHNAPTGTANVAVTGLSYTGPSPFVAVQMPEDLQSGVYVARGFRGKKGGKKFYSGGGGKNKKMVTTGTTSNNAPIEEDNEKMKSTTMSGTNNNNNNNNNTNSNNQEVMKEAIDNNEEWEHALERSAFAPSVPRRNSIERRSSIDRASSRRRASIDLQRATGIAPRGRLVAPMDVDTTAEVAAAVGGYIRRRVQRFSDNSFRREGRNNDFEGDFEPGFGVAFGNNEPIYFTPEINNNNEVDPENNNQNVGGGRGRRAGDIEEYGNREPIAGERVRNTIGGLRVVDIHGRDAAYDAGASRYAQQVAEETNSRPGQEQPCAVQIKLWRYDPGNVNVALENACLTLRRAVLCSEMGAHFSPCGNFLAACVICQNHAMGEYLYELRIYSLQKRNFGEVLSARRIKAAHCLTSVQFSPTSEHVLVAYGRKHSSLILLVAEGGNYVPVHTILEVYRVADMGLVRVIPSAEDEVNAATFHPHAGGGLVYGTKEGRLRLLRFESSARSNLHKKRVQNNNNNNNNDDGVNRRSRPSLEDELMAAERRHENNSDDDDTNYDSEEADLMRS